ncbi:hypothetical protein V6N13_034256 [Hibiscus sabdariffa]
MRWSGRLRLIIESDCKLAIDWLSVSATPPANLARQVSNLIECCKARGIVIRWVPRSCNSLADGLAKKGIG